MNKGLFITATAISAAILLLGFRKRSNLASLAIDASQNALGPLSSIQKKSITAIVKSFEIYGDGDGSKLAYILATTFHESRFKPIKEIRAASGTQLYQIQNAYWNTGYFGRGFVQLTHLANYQLMSSVFNVDLVNNPNLALQTNLAANIMVYGMINGSFTGKKLSDYINGGFNDFFNARRVVNGLDKAQLINDFAISIVNFNPSNNTVA